MRQALVELAEAEKSLVPGRVLIAALERMAHLIPVLSDSEGCEVDQSVREQSPHAIAPIPERTARMHCESHIMQAEFIQAGDANCNPLKDDPDSPDGQREVEECKDSTQMLETPETGLSLPLGVVPTPGCDRAASVGEGPVSPLSLDSP